MHDVPIVWRSATASDLVNGLRVPLTPLPLQYQLVVFGGIESVNNQQHFPKDLFLLDLGEFNP